MGKSFTMLRDRAFHLRLTGLLTALAIAAPAFSAEVSNADHDDLIQMIRDAKSTFQPINPQRLADSKASLATAIADLDRFMMQAGPEVAAGWKAILDWETMQSQLHAARPDWQVLNRVLARYYQDYPGLELPPSLAVREKLRSFVAIGRLLDESQLQDVYEARLDELAQRLEQFRVNPSGENASAMGEILIWLQPIEPDGPQLAEAVRTRYSRANGFGYLSAGLVNQVVSRDANDLRTVREFVLGTSTVGTAKTEGRVVAEMIPNADQAAFDIRVLGTIAVSPNVGTRGSVTIYTTADTRIDVRKRVLFDVTGIHSEPAQSRCTTDVRLHDIEAPRAIMGLVARRMADRKNPQAELEGAQVAERRTAEQLDSEADGLLKVANRVYQEQLLAPLIRLGAAPSSIPFSSTEHELRASVRLASDSQFGAWSPPPQWDSRHDLGGCMHESLVNNFCETLLADKTYRDSDWLDLMQRLVADAPKPLWIYSGIPRWSTVMAAHRPLTVEFGEDRCSISLRLQSIQRGDEQLHRPLQIQADYALQSTPVGPRLIRQGSLQMAIEDSSNLTRQEAELVEFSRQKFEGVLMPELVFEIALPTEKLRSIALTEFTSRDGWLTIGYQLMEERRPQLVSITRQED